jgi:hypothetical protein
MTQTHIGDQLGLCQMQISRLLARALSYLLPRLSASPNMSPKPFSVRCPHEPDRRGTPPAEGGQRSDSNGLQRRSLTICRLEPADDGQPEHASAENLR